MKRIPGLKFTSFERILRLVNVGFTEQEIKEFAEFLAPTMRIDPTERATAQELLSHAWLK